jgi:hypothetical protein
MFHGLMILTLSMGGSENVIDSVWVVVRQILSYLLRTLHEAKVYPHWHLAKEHSDLTFTHGRIIEGEWKENIHR